MRDYFKPLRRKIGVVTLAFGCLLMAGWTRSRTTIDQVFVRKGTNAAGAWFITSIDSGHGIIRWMFSNRTQLNGQKHETHYSWSRASTTDVILGTILDPKSVKWRWRWRGFDFGFEHVDAQFKADTVALIIPYWMFVPPVALLSAWLLLSKPRTRKPRAVEGMINPK